MRIVIAPQSLKGSLTATETGQAIVQGARRVYPEADIEIVPIADGGEGTAQALVDATGGQLIAQQVTGPLGEPVQAFFGLLGEGQTDGITDSGPRCGVAQQQELTDSVCRGASEAWDSTAPAVRVARNRLAARRLSRAIENGEMGGIRNGFQHATSFRADFERFSPTIDVLIVVRHFRKRAAKEGKISFPDTRCLSGQHSGPPGIGTIQPLRVWREDEQVTQRRLTQKSRGLSGDRLRNAAEIENAQLIHRTAERTTERRKPSDGLPKRDSELVAGEGHGEKMNAVNDLPRRICGQMNTQEPGFHHPGDVMVQCECS